ncbi:cellulose synthase regulator protein [Clostridium tertium]|uniref:Cellulose synthase regulator protein n=1 Tax=Clostridium tertium TaxID=1559 RepID=A0A6N2ZNY0_9CLOT
MKVYKKIILLPILFIFIFTMASTKTVAAEKIESNVYSYNWNEDTLLSGSDQIGKTFYIPQNMNPSNFVVTLKIKQSPTLIKDLSSISVLVNNTKVYSIMVDKINAKGELTIKVPENLIAKGENSIVIKGFLKSTREKCEINTDVNWVVIEKGSSFSFKYTRVDSKDISDIFDNTYYSDGKNAEVNVVLPNELIDYNYSQISSISSLMGFIHKNKEVDVHINSLKYSELNTIDKETIVLGTAEQIKAFNKGLLTNEEWKSAEENGYIAIRKIGKKNHFIIITSTEAQLETMCRMLSNKSSLSQIKGNNYILDVNKIVNEKEFNINPSLNDLGYESSSQVGNGIKAFNYYFTIPAKKMLTENNKITFYYSYSNLVDHDNGYVNVEINGENILSKNLSVDNSQDKLEFTIPEKYFDYTSFNISLKFNLKPNVENCTAQSHDNLWIKVDSINSNLNLDLKDREKYSLLNSQGILQNSNGRVEGSILVDSYDNLSLDSICQISYYLGKTSQGVNNLYINEGTDKESEGGAVFALTTSPIVKDMKDNLRIPVSDNGEFINKDLFIQNTSSLGAIEITSDNKLLIIASDKDQLNNTIKKYPEALSSKDTVIIKDGEIIDYFGDTKESENEISGLVKVNYDVILALGVVLGGAILIYIIYLKKVK